MVITILIRGWLVNWKGEVREFMNDKEECTHENVVEVGEQEDGYPGGDIITVKCLNCGKTWRVELPQ